jgi:hypothetical protein
MSLSTPAFVFNTLQKELQDIQIKWLEKIADKYALSLEALKKEFIEDLELIPETKEKVYIYKKYKARRIPMDEDRCKALIWNKGKGGQCSRPCCPGESFCKIHVVHLKYGSVDNPNLVEKNNREAILPRKVY